MGCDIHLQVERRVNGKWERVESLPPRPCSWCDGRGHYKDRPDDKCYSCGERSERVAGKATPGMDYAPYHDRNYTVFSVLAGVRNDGYVKPIAEPRGLPDDCAKPREYDENDEGGWDYGDHSQSWLTLAELQAYDWKQSIKDEGFVGAKAFADWEKSGALHPSEWSGAVSGRMVEHVTHSDMREYIARGFAQHPMIEQIAGKKEFYTLCQWSVPLTVYCKNFLTFMESLTAIGNPEDVRIVFGFDS